MENIKRSDLLQASAWNVLRNRLYLGYIPKAGAGLYRALNNSLMD